MDSFIRTGIPAKSSGNGNFLYAARLLGLLGILLLATGCATTKSFQSVSNLKPAQSQLKIALMPLDVQLSILTAGGTLEPQAEWTRDAKQNMLAALDQIGAQRNNDFIDYKPLIFCHILTQSVNL